MKYLTTEEWKRWLNNDWKHLNWKVNTILFLLASIIVGVIVKFITG